MTPVPPRAYPLRLPRVLVIEDEPDLRATLQAALTAAGHQVAVAAHGQEGLRLHAEHSVQLVITDIFMPEKDGLEIIRHFRRHAPTIPHHRHVRPTGAGRCDGNSRAPRSTPPAHQTVCDA